MTADTYTNTLGNLLMGTGNDNNVWGANLNNSVIQTIEDAIANALTISSTGVTVDISGTPPPAGPSQARYAAIVFTGAGSVILIVPNLTKWWMMKNATAGTILVQTPTGAQVRIPQNSSWVMVNCDGSNVITVSPFSWAQVQMPDGAAAAPAYSNVNELNSGWYRSGTQDWRFSVVGSDVLQLTGPSGSPSSMLNILSPGRLGFAGTAFDPTAAILTGTEIFYAGSFVPTGWLYSNGEAVSRSTYANLFSVITIFGTANTHGNTTIDNVNILGIPDLSVFGWQGAFIEVAGAAAGITIVSITGTSITVSSPIVGSATGTAFRILPYGQGDYNGTSGTTFNVPDRRGRFIAGRDNMGGAPAARLTAATINGIELSAAGGEETHTLVTAELASHNHTTTETPHNHSFTYHVQNAAAGGGFNAVDTITTTGGTTTVTTQTKSTGLTINNTGSGSPHNNVPPAGISNCLIKT